jgi:hypothetical protein
MGKEKIIIDEQLKWITDILKKYKIDYVVDSGTLLGLIRDGELIKWDKDIDISVFDKDINKLDNVVKEAKVKGYKTSTGSYNKLVTGITISPNNIYHNLTYPYIPKNKIRGNRKISVSVLRKKGDLYWEPALFSKEVNTGGLKYKVIKLLKIVEIIAQRIFPKSRLIKKIFGGKKMKAYRYGSRTVPLKYFKKIINLNGLRIPANSKDYLKLRYGSWKIPVKGWNYIKDDKSFYMKSPEEMGFLNKKGK